MTRKQTIVLTTLSITAIILALLLSARLWFRADLTANRAYTISQVSRSLADDIPDQIRISYFVSDKLKSMYPVPDEIEDLIREYVTYARGKIRVQVQDPAKSGLEEQMQMLGIQSQQMQTVERDAANIAMVYSGILIEYLDKYEVIPFVFSTDTLEYDLTSRIRSLVRGTERNAGLLITDASKTQEQNYRNLNQYLGFSGYKTRTLTPGEEIPSTLGAIFVIGSGEGMDDRALYQIDYYIQNGGKVFFLPQAVQAVLSNYGPNTRKIENSTLLKMLENYGVTVKAALVLDKSALITQVSTTGSNGMQIPTLMRYPFWINVQSRNANKDQALTSNFGGLELFWPNPLELAPPAGIEAASLFTSTEEAWLETKDYNINPNESYLFELESSETRGRHILGAALSGRFPSYFKESDFDFTAENLQAMPQEASESRIVVIGAPDFIDDQWLRNELNLSFFVQAADWLGNDDDIIKIRNRAPKSGRLDKIVDDSQRLGAMAWSRMLNTVLIPLAVLILGLVLAWKRKKRTQITKKEASDAV